MSDLFNQTPQPIARNDPEFEVTLLPSGDVVAGSPACGFQTVIIVGYTDQEGVITALSTRASSKARRRALRVVS